MLHVTNSRVLKIVVDKCQHLPKPVRRVRSVDISSYVADHFRTEHGGENNDFRAWTNVNDEDFDIEKTIDEFASLFTGFINISYECTEEEIVHDNDELLNFDFDMTTVRQLHLHTKDAFNRNDEKCN